MKSRQGQPLFSLSVSSWTGFLVSEGQCPSVSLGTSTHVNWFGRRQEHRTWMEPRIWLLLPAPARQRGIAFALSGFSSPTPQQFPGASAPTPWDCLTSPRMGKWAWNSEGRSGSLLNPSCLGGEGEGLWGLCLVLPRLLSIFRQRRKLIAPPGALRGQRSLILKMKKSQDENG